MSKVNKLFSKLEGSVLCFGIEEEEELKAIQKNEKIKECFLLNSIDLEPKTKGSKGKKGKKTSPKRLLKKFRKKGVDFVVIHEEAFANYEKKLLPVFLRLAKRKIYLYHISSLEKIETRYKRYHAKIKCEKEYIEVDVKDVKQNFFLNKMYYLWDSFLDFVDLISDILTS